MSESENTYRAAGVDIDAGNRAVAMMKGAVTATHGDAVLAGVGAFGGLFSLSGLSGLAEPVLAASTDGVGTKVRLATRYGRFDSIGKDLVNHCIDDILVQGARPLFFMDYVASSKLEPAQVAAIVSGMAEACSEAGCALLGGETAEMPLVYDTNKFDLAGFSVGIIEKDIYPKKMGIGDFIFGLPSTGVHLSLIHI